MYMVVDSLRLMKKRYYVYPSSINVPKHFTIILYSKFKKLWIVKFINKYLLFYFRGSISVYLALIKSFNTLN